MLHSNHSMCSNWGALVATAQRFLEYFRCLGDLRNFFNIDSTFLGLQCCGTRLHTPRKHGVWTACYVRGYHAAVGKLLTCKREPRNSVGTSYDSRDRRFIRKWESWCVFHESFVGIKEEAVLCEITGWLCYETMCTKWAAVMSVKYVIYFCGLRKPQKYFTVKISRSTVYYYQDFITLLLLFDGWEGNMAGYCTLVLYFHSPGAHKNTTAHVHYPAVLPSQPSNNIYLTSMECTPCMHHRCILLLAC